MLEICDLATSTPLGLCDSQGYVVRVQAQVLSEAVTLSHIHGIVESQPYFSWFLPCELTSSGPGLC